MGTFTALTAENTPKGQKRKKDGNGEDGLNSLEIDINAPEPPSKKALRRAKRVKVTSTSDKDKSGATDSSKSGLDKDASKAKEVAGRSPHGIWIGNLPFFVTKNDLQAFVTGDTDSAISPDQITRVHLPPGAPKPGSHFQNKGFAYIDFLSAAAVEKALQLSEKLVGGRRVLIKRSKDFQGRPDLTSKTPESKKASSKRMFVGNLEFDTNKENLEHHFGVCGPIHDVHMATFEDSGKCKGYAWVEFEQISSAEAAMRGWVETSDYLANADDEDTPVDANNSNRAKKRIWVNMLGGRKLRMEFAEDKATRYKKRFGKESRSEGVKRDIPDDADQRAAGTQNEGAKEVDANYAQAKTSSKKSQKASQLQHVRSGYPASSIQKMTGAITEGQGTKITFE